MEEIITSCPNCSKDLTKEEVGTNVKYKNESAIIIYECPHCNENYKINPYEHFAQRNKEGKKLKSYKEFETLPSETAAKYGLFFWVIPIAVIIYFILS